MSLSQSKSSINAQGSELRQAVGATSWINFCYCPLLVLFCLSSLPLLAQMNTYQDAQGRSIRADILELNGDQVTLIREDGQRFTTPIALFSTADQTRIRTRFSASPISTVQTSTPSESAVTPAQINEALGINLFADTQLWDDTPERIAEALRLSRESKTAYEASYRSYPAATTRLLGARPHSIAFYAKEGTPEALSIVFINPGDLPLELQQAGINGSLDTRSLLNHLNTFIKRDTEAIQNALEPLLGRGQYFAMGQGTLREATQRWDWQGHSILLTSEKDGYVALSILPSEVADGRGRAEWTPSYEVKERMQNDLLKNDFGDVILQNLPMVNQGPKGYCVPATFERVMRYFGISADMYKLAQVGGTGIGGGTSVSQMVDAVETQVKRSGRKFERIKLGSSLSSITRYIDQGIPILWLMYSGDDYNQRANSRTAAREKSSNPRAWDESLRDERKDAKKMSIDTTAGHICIIVGYNKTTGEVAVSDSWGPEYELRWVLFEEVERVSIREVAYVIEF